MVQHRLSVMLITTYLVIAFPSGAGDRSRPEAAEAARRAPHAVEVRKENRDAPLKVGRLMSVDKLAWSQHQL